MDYSLNVPALLLDGQVIWIQNGDLSNDGGRSTVKIDNESHNFVGFMMEPFLKRPHDELISKTQQHIAERVLSDADGYHAAIERGATPGRISAKLRELRRTLEAAEFFDKNKDRLTVGTAEAWFDYEE